MGLLAGAARLRSGAAMVQAAPARQILATAVDFAWRMPAPRSVGRRALAEQANGGLMIRRHGSWHRGCGPACGVWVSRGAMVCTRASCRIGVDRRGKASWRCRQMRPCWPHPDERLAEPASVPLAIAHEKGVVSGAPSVSEADLVAGIGADVVPRGRGDVALARTVVTTLVLRGAWVLRALSICGRMARSAVASSAAGGRPVGRSVGNA